MVEVSNYIVATESTPESEKKETVRGTRENTKYGLFKLEESERVSRDITHTGRIAQIW